MLRSSARLLRKLCDKSHSSGRRGVEAAAAAAARRLSGTATSSARDTSLLRALPGLDLPPALPDLLGRSPTVITTLPNGVRVASEDVPGPSACIGIFVDSGSIYESGVTRGVSHLLEKLAFKDTSHRSHQQIVQELELAGGNVGASAAREQMVYSYDTLKAYMPEAVEILLDCVMNPLFSHDEVEYQLTLALEEVQQMQRNPERFLMETLNLVGYSGALANPLIAPEEAFATINSSIIKKLYHVQMVAGRVRFSGCFKVCGPLPLVDLPSEGILIVPQRPYTSLGTLRDQIIYPLSLEEAELKMLSDETRVYAKLTVLVTTDKSTGSKLLDDHLKTILENVHLLYLREREGWDATPNWEDILALGEQQRLGMARLFFHCPKYGIGILDECTNAASVDVEEHLYRLATNMGITVITSSQRPALIPFHSLELKLIDGEGKLELCNIRQ